MAAEIRCPKCGKPNPADAEVCRYCRAQIQPVSPGSASRGEGDDEPDWLRALRADDPKSPKSPSGAADDSSADVPDWLSRIRQKATGDENSSGLFADDEPGEADPDWMKGLAAEETPAADLGSSDDWLSRLGGVAEEPAKPAPADEPLAGGNAGEPDLSSWLAGLAAQDQPAADNLPAEPPAGSAPAGSTPVFDDWSGGSLFVDDAAINQPAADNLPAQDLPAASDDDDWLSKLNFDSDAPLGGQPPASQASDLNAGLWADMESGAFDGESSLPASSTAEENLDWLSSLKADATGEPSTKPVEPQPGEQTTSGWGLTGWLSQDSKREEPIEPAQAGPGSEEVQPEAGLPDWLSGTPGAEPATPSWTDEEPSAPAAQPPAELSDSEVPSWLLEDTAGPLEQESPAPLPDRGVPSWLVEEPSTPEQQAPEPQAPDSGVPAWLAGFNEAQPPAQTSASELPAAPMASDAPGREDLPAWLRSDMGGEETTPAPRSEPRNEGLPSWFSSFNEPDAREPQEQQSADEQPDFNFNPFSMPDEPARPEPAQPQPSLAQTLPEEQPGWLTSLQADKEESAPQEEPLSEPARKGSTPLPFIEEGLPDWMNEFQGQPAVDATVPPLIPVEEVASAYTSKDQPFDIELPAWLDEEAQHGADQLKQAEAGQPGSEDLAEAELPSWVAAMRPVETAIQGDAAHLENDQLVERAGPLSGMRGMLPADDSVINYRKPPVYSMKLRVTEKQRGHASLLESLIGQETQPLVLPPVKSQAPQVVLRVLVALFMLLVLAGALLINLQLTPVPTLLPPDMIDLFDQVQSLPPDQTVLLAVDFEPGLSGEMRFASSMVIDHLMARGAQMAIVSTVPTGPAMADSLLKQVQANRPEYDLSSRVENLGYLPGGTISLVEFARDPRGAAPRTVEGENAWEQPILAGVDDIQKFARVIVITDRAEIGRDWVEQVQPYLGGVPLLIVSSAQAAPLLEPYVQSHQVQGLVSGLMGGVLYGQQSGRQDVNPAMGHYGAYQVGVLLAFVLVLVGAIFSSIVSLVSRKKKNGE